MDNQTIAALVKFFEICFAIWFVFGALNMWDKYHTVGERQSFLKARKRSFLVITFSLIVICAMESYLKKNNIVIHPGKEPKLEGKMLIDSLQLENLKMENKLLKIKLEKISKSRNSEVKD